MVHIREVGGSMPFAPTFQNAVDCWPGQLNRHLRFLDQMQLR
jgi:hypothetical protein